MTAHPMIEQMEQFLEDARRHEHPEKLWRYRDVGTTSWKACTQAPGWNPSYEYSRRPVTLNGHEYPLPETEPPEIDARYYYPRIYGDGRLATETYWSGDSQDMALLRGGLVHLTQEAAEAHAQAIILAGGGEL